MNRAASKGALARFGAFELHVSSGELRKNGSKVRLQEQPFRLLATLLERAGEVVTRDELRERLWPADTFVDFDHSLNTAVRKLRTALADSAEAPRFVETVARHGYRFLGSVEWVDGAPMHAARSGVRRRVFLIAAAVVAVVAAIGARIAYIRPPAAAPPRVDSVAVLPFAVTDTASEYLGDGLAETVIDELSMSPDLRVAPRSSTFRYKGRSLDPRAIGGQLDVGTIVTGTLTSAPPDGYELRAELIDAGSGSQLWAKQYRVRAADLDVLRRQIAFDVSYRLGVTRADDARRRGTSSPALDLYLRGRYHWNRRGREDVLRAADYFERAVALDPNFALGYSGLANAYGVIYGNHYLPGNDVAMAEKSRAAADKALQLDDTLAEAYASRAAGFSSYYRDFAAAERDFRRAIELKPAYAPAHQWYSFHLGRLGRLAESRREAELAYQLEPFSRAMNATLCWGRKYARRYDEAIEFSRRAAQRDRSIVNYWCLFQVEALDGRYEDAIATVRTAPRDLDPSNADPLEIAYIQGGPAGFWRKSAELTPESEPYEIAEYLAMAGERDDAFTQLEIAERQRASELGGLRRDPMFDNLRSDPRFDELVRRIGLP